MKKQTEKIMDVDCKIYLQQKGNELKVELEGSIKDWFIVLERVSDRTPEFKKAIILCANFFEFENNQND
jgi:hypothetical protein